ncbi:hypothetical protein BDF14DRAFT_1782422 [Spinellus fusiger]|nr:hypothetical protein BDF14DRAFT_1782422 [Spinellus fusiger]
MMSHTYFDDAYELLLNFETDLQPTPPEKLNLYSLYMQITQGDCYEHPPPTHTSPEYIKWKAWECLRGLPTVHAQSYYVDSVVDLARRFIQQNPLHPTTPLLQASLVNLGLYQAKITSPSAKDHIHTPQLYGSLEDFTLPPVTSRTSFPPLLPEMLPTRCNDNHPTHSHNSNTSHTSHNYQKRRDMDPSLSDSLAYDHRSDTTADREGAVANVSLYPSIEGFSSYPPTGHHRSHTSLNSNINKAVVTERAIEKLQTQVAALTEQLSVVRRQQMGEGERKGQWQWYTLWLAKTLAKHAMVDGVLLVLVFLAMWYHKSPIAYTLLRRWGRATQQGARHLVMKAVDWRKA